jgi:sialate O-acetylesterase
MKTQLIIGVLLLSIFVGCNKQTHIPLAMQPLFSSNMVFQQQQDIHIWGVATSGTTVTVHFKNQKVSVKTNPNGKWTIKLKPEPISYNEKLIIETKAERIELNNIAVGEVWIASGQSNMEVALVNNWGPIINGETEAQNAQYPDIRLFTVGRNATTQAVDTIHSSGWKVCTPETVKDFSAAAYFFGRELHKELNVPIGLISSSWGGTVAEAWTSHETLGYMENYTALVAKIRALPHNDSAQFVQFEEDNSQMHNEMALLDPGIEGTDTIFTNPLYDHSDWMVLDLPVLWESTLFGVFDGSAWFRKNLEIPADFITGQLTLNLGPSDDMEEAWINGVKVGQSNFWGKPRTYQIPAGLLLPGDNSITLRVSDFQGAGGFNGKESDFYIANDAGKKLDISKTWHIHAGYNKQDIETVPLMPGDPNRPTVLFNGMINPLIPFGFKGVIWYQGESNTGSAWQYRDLFSSLITDWRKHWQAGDFPFIYVQLANHMARNLQPVDDMWAELREAQTLALKLPNTGMAVAIDIGDALDIHPGNKQDIGKRLALWALNKSYAKDIAFSGPQYKNHKIEGNKIVVSFDHVLNGLNTADNNKLKGFAIAGNDKKFVWAKAKTDGDKVIVWSDEIENPVAVRYAWSANPECNLINSALLPASPFRTDNWKLLTQ